MRPMLWTLMLLLLTSFATLPSAQAKGALYFEKVILTDEAQDFPQGALDIENVYLSELYPFDPDQDLSYDRIILRIEPRSLNDMGTCQVPSSTDGYRTLCRLRVDVRFEVAGAPQHLFALFDAPGKGTCCPVLETNTLVNTDGVSIKMSLDRPAFNMFPGSKIEKLYVTTDLIVEGQARPGDRAPGDNQNKPYDARPELDSVYAPAHTLEGTYEFFTLEVQDGTHRDSVGGQAVEFNVLVRPTTGVRDDTIRFLFDMPSAWSLTPSRGTTGVAPRGLITGLSEGNAAEMGLTVSSKDLVETGTTYTIIMNVYSSTQGFQSMPLTVRVTGPTIEDPDYVFQWQEAPNLKVGTTGAFHFQVLDAAKTPRADLPIDVVFSKDGRRVHSVPATADGAGYRVDYSFPSAGTWTLDARLMGMEPSPHGAITVQVQEGSSIPSVGALPLLGVLAFAGLLKGKSRLRP
jgi:hypothetical protein